MISGTLSLRFKPSVTRPPAPPMRSVAPPRPPASAAQIAAATWRARPSRPPAAPVLPPAIGRAILDGLPSQSFVDTFDMLFDQQDPADPNPALRPCDRTVLRFLLTYRWCSTRPTPDEIAARLDREVRFVRQSIHRLRQAALLPCGDSL